MLQCCSECTALSILGSANLLSAAGDKQQYHEDKSSSRLHIYLHILANLFHPDKKCPKYVRNEQR